MINYIIVILNNITQIFIWQVQNENKQKGCFCSEFNLVSFQQIKWKFFTFPYLFLFV